MRRIARSVLVLLSSLPFSVGSHGADWALPASYDMSFPYLKAYRYGPMLGGIGTAGFSFNTMGLCNFRLFNYHLNEGNLDGTFFAVYVKNGQREAVRFLQSYGRPEKRPLDTGTPVRLKRGVGAEVGGEERRQARQEVGEQLGAHYGQKMVSQAYCSSLPPALEMRYVD